MPKGKGTTEIGYTNRNGQKVVRHTDLEGTDHNQYVYVLRCNHCGQEYGANGSDIWLRKCPYCQGGAPGLPLEYRSYALNRSAAHVLCSITTSTPTFIFMLTHQGSRVHCDIAATLDGLNLV